MDTLQFQCLKVTEQEWRDIVVKGDINYDI